MDSERIKERIRENAAEIVRLHSRIHETCTQRSKSSEKMREWKQACRVSCSIRWSGVSGRIPGRCVGTYIAWRAASDGGSNLFPGREKTATARAKCSRHAGGRSADKNGLQTAVQGLSEQAAAASARPATNLLQCPLKQHMPLL